MLKSYKCIILFLILINALKPSNDSIERNRFFIQSSLDYPINVTIKSAINETMEHIYISSFCEFNSYITVICIIHSAYILHVRTQIVIHKRILWFSISFSIIIINIEITVIISSVAAAACYLEPWTCIDIQILLLLLF